MSTEDHRARYAAELAAHAPSASPFTPSGGSTVRRAFAAFRATGGDVAERVAAVDAARFDGPSQPDTVPQLLEVLRDATDDPVVRRAAIGALQEMSFGVTTFERYAGQYRAALRAAATDRDPELRERAIEILALARDEYAQRLLVEGLRGEAEPLVSRQRALLLLGHDLHAEHYGLLRQIAESATDAPEERRAALRLLAADSGSADLFLRIVRDRAEDGQARAISAAALTSLDPDGFAEVARDIALDDDDDDDVRATCLTALAINPRPDTELAERTATTSDRSSSVELNRAARWYAEAASPRPAQGGEWPEPISQSPEARWPGPTARSPEARWPGPTSPAPEQDPSEEPEDRPGSTP